MQSCGPPNLLLLLLYEARDELRNISATRFKYVTAAKSLETGTLLSQNCLKQQFQLEE
jgi:hypothetical protein